MTSQVLGLGLSLGLGLVGHVLGLGLGLVGHVLDSITAFYGHTRSLEPTRIERLHMTSY